MKTIEDFIEQKRICRSKEHNHELVLQTLGRCTCANLIPADDLREFMQGKVVVSKETIFTLRECIEVERIRWRRDLKTCASDKASVDRINAVLAELGVAFDDLGQALQPTPSGDAKCQGCNGHGLVGNILDTDTCPFCKGTGTTSGEVGE